MKTVTYDDAAWVLVPIEPTLEMKVGGNQELSAWVAPAMHSVDAWRAMLKAAPIPTAQIQPDAIHSFDEFERRYFPEERKKRLRWEAEQRALIWRGATLNNQAQPSAQDREDVLTSAARDVLAERQRQISAKGWTPEHDDEHSDCSMAQAAACYALDAAGYSVQRNLFWPWAWKFWKPSDPRRNLIKAGALILAEIERIDRATARATKDKS